MPASFLAAGQAFLRQYFHLITQVNPELQLLDPARLQNVKSAQELISFFGWFVEHESEKMARKKFSNCEIYEVFDFPYQSLLFSKNNILYESKEHLIWRSCLLDILTSEQIE